MRHILLILPLIFSVKLQAFEWKSYTNDLLLAREVGNSQMMTKAPNYDVARYNLEDLISQLSNGSLNTGAEYKNQFLLGLSELGILKLNRVTIWHHIGKNGSEYWLNSDEFKTQNAIITEHYVNGLNHAIETGEKIDPQWLYIITESTILDTQVREAVIKYEMNLNKNSPPTETYFWDSYSSIYEAYLNKKDYENAQRILDEMEDEFPNLKEKVITARQKVKAYVEKTKPSEIIEPVKPKIEAVLEKVEKTIAQQDEKAFIQKQEETKKDTGFGQYTIHEKYNVFIVAIAVVLGLFVVSRVRRKRS